MFVIIGTTTADLLIFSRQSHNGLDKISDDGFRTGNLEFCDQPPKMLMGGNGGCSAFVLAGLGVSTALCSAVGRDHFGDKLVSWLEDRNVNLEAMFRSENHATSASTIIMSDAANQVVYHHLGATRDISPDLFLPNLREKARVLLITSYSLIPELRRGGFNSILSAIHEAGGICALDVGPAIGEPVLSGEIQPLLPNLDYLIGNSHELSVLNHTTDWEESSRQLLAVGANCIIIKRGEDGASVRSADTDVDVPGFQVESRISVGAGDAFNVGFLLGAQQGWPLTRSVRFANGLAAMIVMSANGVLNAPTLVKLEAFLASNGTAGFQLEDQKR